jgi:HPt (histidine-containing phosphotransfer) domain-containing protein
VQSELNPRAAGATLPTKAFALRFVSGDEELLGELVNVFLDDCPRLLSELQSAAVDSDAPALKRTAHTIKGAVLNFGDAAAVEVAQRLETMGATNNLAGAVSVCAALEDRLNKIRPVLMDWSVHTVLKS